MDGPAPAEDGDQPLGRFGPIHLTSHLPGVGLGGGQASSQPVGAGSSPPGGGSPAIWALTAAANSSGDCPFQAWPTPGATRASPRGNASATGAKERRISGCSWEPAKA